MAYEEERYEIIRHISSLYQDIANTGNLSDKELDNNAQIGDDFAECILNSLSMEVLGKDGDFIQVKVKVLDVTSVWLDNYMAEPLVEDTNL